MEETGIENKTASAPQAPRTPQAALDAICAPDALTLAHVALLERMKSQILLAKAEDTLDNIKAVYAVCVCKSPMEALSKLRDGTLESAALDWIASVPPAEYIKLLASLLDAVTAFWKMLPRPDNGETDAEGNPVKKNSGSETAS